MKDIKQIINDCIGYMTAWEFDQPENKGHCEDMLRMLKEGEKALKELE